METRKKENYFTTYSHKFISKNGIRGIEKII
jgi:hypothetical protein